MRGLTFFFSVLGTAPHLGCSVKGCVAIPIAAALITTCWVARADDEKRECNGVHSLFAPLPDACLAVIDTDRPHQTDTPHVVPAGHVQVESAVVALQLGQVDQASSGSSPVHFVAFENNYKFGLVSDVDLQIMFKHVDYVPALRSLEPPGPLAMRAKFNFVKEHGALPAVTFVPWILLPVAPSQVLRGGPLLFWAWELPAHLELEMNAGIFFGEAPKPAVATVLASALTFTIVDNLGVFVDVYATGGDVSLGTGALWAFTRDLQLDAGTYIGLSAVEPVATPFVGFSLRP